MDPEDVALTKLLRRALCDHVDDAGTKRALPTVLHIGAPGGGQIVVPEMPGLDSGLRADLVERALDGFDTATEPMAPMAWLTRIGELAPGDADLAWFSASREGFGRHGLSLPGFFVMTRYGWLDLADGEVVRWRRIRRTRALRAS